jgi:hypothetical protein
MTSIATSARPPGSSSRAGPPCQSHDPPLVRDDPVAGLAVRAEGVDVERKQPVRGEVRPDGAQRGLDVGRRRQVVHRIVEARDEVEGSVDRERPHVRHVHLGTGAQLAAGDRSHRRRAVAARRLEPELEQR